MKITITIDEHLLNTIEEMRGNKSKSELCNEYLEPDLFDIYKGHVREAIDIINEEIDLTEYGDLHSKAVAENVFLKEKLKRVHKIRDESNRQFLNYLKRLDITETPTPEYIAHCKKMMENPNFVNTISDARSSGFLFYQYVCENILDTYQKYNNTTAKISFADAPLVLE
jgi:predicted CopG family antitoxin